jgi:hypothetical protein
MTAGVGWLANEIVREVEGGRGKGAIYDEVSWRRGFSDGADG